MLYNDLSMARKRESARSDGIHGERLYMHRCHRLSSPAIWRGETEANTSDCAGTGRKDIELGVGLTMWSPGTCPFVRASVIILSGRIFVAVVAAAALDESSEYFRHEWDMIVFPFHGFYILILARCLCLAAS